jgi:hypothetical protein
MFSMWPCKHISHIQVFSWLEWLTRPPHDCTSLGFPCFGGPNSTLTVTEVLWVLFPVKKNKQSDTKENLMPHSLSPSYTPPQQPLPLFSFAFFLLKFPQCFKLFVAFLSSSSSLSFLVFWFFFSLFCNLTLKKEKTTILYFLFFFYLKFLFGCFLLPKINK